ncbi:hypothetical protein Mapa_010913 [Marchantia paleacea]|nr:hypothetical protein Mapa_010913 [Marchantia paleacea]
MEWAPAAQNGRALWKLFDFAHFQLGVPNTLTTKFRFLISSRLLDLLRNSLLP